MLEHETGVPHWPFDPQVATALSEPPSAPVAHSVDPCAHTPWHEAVVPLATHVWLPQLVGLPNWPFESHVSSELPEHVLSPGEQLPWHDATPDVTAHVEPEQATAVPQFPLLSHVCTPLVVVEHCVAPGVHTPTHWPATHAWFTHRVVEPEKCPVLSQACSPLLRQV